MTDKHFHFHIHEDDVKEPAAGAPAAPLQATVTNIPMHGGVVTVGLPLAVSTETQLMRLTHQLLYAFASLQDPRVNAALKAVGCTVKDNNGKDLIPV